jgi:hypothetical protein
VDAWFILARSPNFDWEIFRDTTAAARLDLPVYHVLRYLADQLGAVVPVRVLEQIGSGAVRAGFVERQAARPWPTARYVDPANAAGGWWQSFRTAWGRVFPPPVQFALHYDVPLWTVPFYYIFRLMKYLLLERPAGTHGGRSDEAAAATPGSPS